jgi:hypothetical protein
MRFGGDHLRAKALLALEEAAQECRYDPVPQTFAIRFALAYLWSLAPTSREPFDDFWRTLSANHAWRFSSASQSLGLIYQQLGSQQDHELGMQLWARCAATRRGKADGD